MTRYLPPCEMKPGTEPQACVKAGYNCGYCQFPIAYGEWTVKGHEVGDSDDLWYTIHVSHTAAVDGLVGVERHLWLEVPEVLTHEPIVVNTAVTPTYSEPMSEDEAIAHGRRGHWIVCITPEKQRNRRWVVAK